MSCEVTAAQEALRLFVSKSRAQLQQLLQRLNWTEAGVLQLHRPSAKQDATPAEPLPSSCCSSAEHSVQLSAELLKHLFPDQKPEPLLEVSSFQDLQMKYNAEQRLTLYEHVLSRTPRQHLSFEQQADFAHLVAETKRAQKKQRKQRHRKCKPTLREEMHQLVQLQMQALQRQQEEQQRETQRKQRLMDSRPVSPRKRRSRSPSWTQRGRQSPARSWNMNRSRRRSKTPSRRSPAHSHGRHSRTHLEHRSRSPKSHRRSKKSRSRSRTRNQKRSRRRSHSRSRSRHRSRSPKRSRK